MNEGTRRIGLAISVAVALASGIGLVVLRSRGSREDPVVATLGDEVSLRVSGHVFTLVARGEQAGSIARIDGPRGPLLGPVALGAAANGKPAQLILGALVLGKKRVVEADAEVVQGAARAHGRLRFTPRGSPARLEVQWMGPTLGGDRVALTLTARDLRGPVVVPGGPPATSGARDAAYALVPLPLGVVALSGGSFVWGDAAPWVEVASPEGVTLACADGAAQADAVRAVLRGAVLRPEGMATYRGHVEPPMPGASVVAFDDRGRVASAGRVDEAGAFVLAAVPGQLRAQPWIGGFPAGELVPLGPGDTRVPGREVGRLVVEVTDADTHGSLPSRIVVHGAGAREPNFGSPERATGAGPLVDADDGAFATLLPAGRYRVLATRGLEYSVDARDLEVAPGATVVAKLGLRRVVDTPGWAACDLHVHSRGSFDSTVSIDDRVRSLVAAGVDFAAATEHNRIGSYASPRFAAASRWFSWVSAVEVTTTNPLRGHFNVIPFEGPEAPKHQRTTLDDLVRFVRKASPDSLLQVNHPRLTGGIGYFHTVHLDPDTGRGLSRVARGFDTVEVYNGFDLPTRARVEEVLLDWLHLLEGGRTVFATGSSDSHAVQYVAAGYPRTYAAALSDHDGGEGPPVDVRALVESLRKGRAFATSGPIVELSQGDRQPGDAVVVAGGAVSVHVRVRAAPWIDARSLEVYVGAKSVLRRELPPREPLIGKPEGDLASVRKAAILLDEDLSVPVADRARALVVVVRGERSVGEVMPFMDWKPMAISNPLFLSGDVP